MSAIANKPIAFELRRGRETSRARAAIEHHRLRPTEDGWSLIAPDGEVIFRGLGLASRRRCLELARDLGVLSVLS